MYSYQTTCFIPDINNSFTNLEKDSANNVIMQYFHSLVDKHFRCRETLYTDGSKTEQSRNVGASVWIVCLGQSIKYKLSAKVSIFTAEAWAIFEAVGIIEELQWKDSVIFTDSLSVLRATAQQHHKDDNYVIYKLKHKLLLLKEAGYNLTLCWIPAYKGISGNEAANVAAKEAARCDYSPPFRISYADFFAEANTSKDCKFKAYLKDKACITGTQHATFYQNTLSKRPWFHRMPLSRGKIVIINRLRSNHYNLNYSLHKKNMIDSQSCNCGNGRQDANHIIFYCPLTIPKFSKLREYIKDNFPLFEINIFPMLKNPIIKICRLILGYFKSCNLVI